MNKSAQIFVTSHRGMVRKHRTEGHASDKAARRDSLVKMARFQAYDYNE